MHHCACGNGAVQRYLSRVSGPILDRIDIHIEVPPVKYNELSGTAEDGERSADIRARVNRARKVQLRRFKDLPGVHANARITSARVQRYCQLDEDGERILKRSIESFGFSARAYHRILKVARTIADCDGGGDIRAEHVSEAIQYRTLDRNLWIS